MNKNQQIDCQEILLIEKEYINNMLGSCCQDLDSSDASDKVIDFNDAYKKQDIECRVFDIAGLKIAVPVSNIRKILEQQQVSMNTKKQSKPSMCTGKIVQDSEIIDVIDIGRLAMHDINCIDNSHTDKQLLTDIVLLKNSSTGFICNATLDKQTVSKEHVRWRDTSSERIWLAGTVAQMGLSLLDIEGVVRLLQESYLE